VSRPYTQTAISERLILREFSESVTREELEWHMDRRDRRIKVLGGSGWKLQLESGLPFDLQLEGEYLIPKESWHRVIKGQGALKILISET
jgi:hypothetical protein